MLKFSSCDGEYFILFTAINSVEHIWIRNLTSVKACQKVATGIPSYTARYKNHTQKENQLKA